MLFSFVFFSCFAFVFVSVHGYNFQRQAMLFDTPQQSFAEYTCGTCLNGHCSEPDSCNCNDGYGLDIKGVCVPVCTQPCLNGKCIAPNKCECESGFHLDQATTTDCISDCPKGCTNGTCIERVCKCNPGYEYTETNSSGVCGPICTLMCVNSVCVAPGKYECIQGYEMITPENECEPICNDLCFNAQCVAPDTCECDPGHRFDNDSNTSCLPICSGCESGICSAPDTCECFDGYRLVTDTITNTTDCEAICEPPCSKGKCIGTNLCWEDLGERDVMSDDNRRNNSTCEAACGDNCEGGKCVPNCEEGFELTLTDMKEYVCKPLCRATCGNGTCVAPDKCRCDLGYEQKFIGQMCQPVCKSDCFNGVCIAPDECECDAGYKFDNNSTTSCFPHCSNGCDNGTCIGPDVCQCFPGYFLVTNSTSNRTACELNCEPTCENGTCTVGDLCVPHLGGSSGGEPCGPNCAQCLNETCLQFCESGYELKKVLETNETKCEPVCNTTCVNSTCTAPDVCSCLHGYEPEEGNSTCRPVCRTGCPNAVCVEPDMCQCNDGYRYNGHVDGCQPHCVIDCGNGTCIEPDTCQCGEGYISTVTGNNMGTRHCASAPRDPESAKVSGGSNKVTYIALSVLAAGGVLAAALAVYWLKFFKTGSYSTQEVCPPQQMNSSF